jgi:glycosyltransferase involved in cell wall biosynthesis
MSDQLLTISIPTYRRVDLLERCLASIVPHEESTWESIELVVSDNSPESDVEDCVERFSRSWTSPLRYHRNPPGTGAVRNFNHCIERARGRYNLMLHDDDYLLPGAVDTIVRTLRAADHARDKVLLFGVQDVDLSGTVIRRHRFAEDEFLSPPSAMHPLLRNSSFVRVPGLVVENAAYRAVGGFKVSAHTTCDLDMSVRLFSRFGVRCLPQLAAAYTVHPGGITTTVFTPETIARTVEAIDVARNSGVLDQPTIDRLQRRFFHQFILAGTWRALKRHDRRAAREVYALFALPEIRAQGLSLYWLPVRFAFAILSGALWRTDPSRSAADNASYDDNGRTPSGWRGHDGEAQRSSTKTTREW